MHPLRALPRRGVPARRGEPGRCSACARWSRAGSSCRRRRREGRAMGTARATGASMDASARMAPRGLLAESRSRRARVGLLAAPRAGLRRHDVLAIAPHARGHADACPRSRTKRALSQDCRACAARRAGRRGALRFDRARESARALLGRQSHAVGPDAEGFGASASCRSCARRSRCSHEPQRAQSHATAATRTCARPDAAAARGARQRWRALLGPTGVDSDRPRTLERFELARAAPAAGPRGARERRRPIAAQHRARLRGGIDYMGQVVRGARRQDAALGIMPGDRRRGDGAAPEH